MKIGYIEVCYVNLVLTIIIELLQLFTFLSPAVNCIIN